MKQEAGQKPRQKSVQGILRNEKKDQGKNRDYKENKAGHKNSMCPVFSKCGGCQFLDMPYKEELHQKFRQTEKLLRPFCPVSPVIGMEDPFRYRNKVHAVFGHKKDGTIISGTYQEGTHYIVPVDECLLDVSEADAIIRDIRDLLRSFKIKTYNEDTGYGLFRHVQIRKGHKSGQILVTLVIGSPVFPSKNNFVKALRKLHPEITSIVLNINDRRTSMVLGDRETVLYGKGYIEDELCGKIFRISSKSFYQVNSVQTEILYGKAIELSGLRGTEKVIDAYCGIGTIGMIAADHAKEVIGVELNKDAVRDAAANAKRNQMTNITFYNADAGDFMQEMAERSEKADVLFMDPPRSGSTPQFMDAAVKLRPEKIVYISCNPETLARDLKFLTTHGYKAEKAVPVDMFPQVNHVETVCLLTHS